MILTNKQEEALRIIRQNFKSRVPYTCISGFAGTGKSTIINVAIEALGINTEFVAYVTFTGKAASVLQHKGCPNATTIHKLLYKSTMLPNGKFRMQLRERWEISYRLIIVDEVSMVPAGLWRILLSYHIPIIACGDPF